MSALDLTTVTLVRQWIPETATTPSGTSLTIQTSVLQSAITAASVDFLRRTGRASQNGAVPQQSPFVQAVEYTETYDGNGTERMFLRNTPILSVISLSIFGNLVSPSTGPTTCGYVIDGNGKSISFTGPAGYNGWWGGRPWVPFAGGIVQRFPRGNQNIQVVYTAGYAEQPIVNELQTVPATPFTITPLNPWLADNGVRYFSSGNPLTAVTIAPAQGQYYLNNGTYLFNAADAGQQMLLNYDAPGTPPDVELAVRRMVYLIYKRRGWEGLRSLMKPESGQTNYTTWEIDPSVQTVIDNYTRTALV